MVSLDLVQSSNARIKTDLQPGLVAVFVGATDGVGETTVRQFAKYAASPRVYIVGRSQEAGERVAQECRDVNPEGTFIFIKHETSLISNVENLCNKLAAEEKTVNVLFLTVGTLEIAGSMYTARSAIQSLLSLTVGSDSRRIALRISPDNLRSKSFHLPAVAAHSPSQWAEASRYDVRCYVRGRYQYVRLSRH